MTSGDGGRLVVLDALRALAVTAVVLFHVFPTWVPGGFVGVDMFFLISGFIIWHQYGEKLVSEETRWHTFFARRVRRLVPAYLVLLIATTLGAYYVLPPDLLLEYGQSLFAQAIYSQNFVFLAQGDYFVDPMQRPLLHTWSLAIEEQFYFLFFVPILLRKWSGKRWPIALAALGLASFTFAVATAQFSARAAFFLLPARAWEFAAGIGAAIVYERVRVLPRLSGAPVAAAGALALILASIWAFDERGPFPGPHTALALTGAFILCVLQQHVGALFVTVSAARPVQHFGRISYSWYLWHWPLISLYAVWSGRAIDAQTGVALLVVGYSLGVASYVGVEKVAQRSEVLKQGRYMLLLLVAFISFAAAAGVLLIRSKGAIERYPVADQPYIAAKFDRPSERCPIVNRLALWGASVCQRNDLTQGEGVLLLGDSHSNMIREAFTQIGTSAGSRVFLNTNICRPKETGKLLCRRGYWKGLTQDIAKHGIHTVLLAVSWPLDFRRSDFLYSISKLRAAGVKVFVLLPTPTGDEFDPNLYVGKAKMHDLALPISPSRFSRRDYLSLRGRQRTILGAIAAHDPGVRLIDPAIGLCPTTKCVFAVGGRPTHSDQGHITTAGVGLIQQELSKVFVAND